LRASLESTSKTENDGTNKDSPSTAKSVTKPSGESSTKESAACED